MPDDNTTDLDDLGVRFLHVFDALFKMAGHRVPDQVVGQLHLNQLHTLHILYRQPGIPQKTIAEHLGITPAAVSTAMRDMESLGLVERRPDETDARMMCLFLSERGKEIVDEAVNMRHQAIITLLSALPLADQQTVVELLERAVSALQSRNTCWHKPDAG